MTAGVVGSLVVATGFVAVTTPTASAAPRIAFPGYISCSAIAGNVKFSTPIAPGKSTPATATITLRISDCVGTIGTTLPGTLTGVLKATTALERMDCQDLTTSELAGPGSGSIKWQMAGEKLAPSLVTWPDFDTAEISWNGFYPNRAHFIFGQVTGSFANGDRGALGVPYTVTPQALATACTSTGIRSIRLGSSTGFTGLVL